MQELYQLGEKINALLKKYASLLADNNSLQQTVSRQAEQIEALHRQLDTTKAQLLAAEIANALPGVAEKEQTRKQLDAVISEIDKVLTNLND